MIRPATIADLAAIRACADAAYARYVPLIGRKPAPMLADYGAQIAAGHVHVAADEGILGFAVFFPAGDHMLLENVAVLPQAAGRGIGKALIGFCEEAARRHGLRSVQLYTNAAMHANLSIYPHFGYEETGRRSADGFDRVYFQRQL